MINPSQKERLTIRIDAKRKQEAAEVAESLGTDLSNVINMFLAQMIKEQALPFTPGRSKSKSELDEALEDVEAGRVSKFSSPDALFRHLHDLEKTAN
ncbi:MULTISPECIES: type II toxin-antitoxin system RelB/DinJ family antitoxin [Lactobacillaceae]|uniref:type II toxin-antitoxin system RelB/DinJ family antitoxin n=1 Tax=Lactobacillaceae TaxID=33958 RepID=UPI0014574CA6|nr:type II toxin-antitoxin system RelB/DinJ family antitoxin [Lactobacillus sp. HBUAS51381]NLR10122.1 type II toxin-antitoxin system RelB/DinJ family antitoxin [Lactobacillus sp. HBUAS51381]